MLNREAIAKGAEKQRRIREELPSVQRIRGHYHRMGARSWPISRFYELCRYMRVTEEEMAALCNATSANLKSWKTHNAVRGPAVLILELLRQFYTERATGKTSDPLIPIGMIDPITQSKEDPKHG